MLVANAQLLFSLSTGDTVSKRNLFDLIQYSKIQDSSYWAGREWAIQNTPQQGINWIGKPPSVKGVLIKTRPGAYKHDGWQDRAETAYRYSFKSRKGTIFHSETANLVLIEQPEQLYPIFLFIEAKANWIFHGTFSVAEIQHAYVVLTSGRQIHSNIPLAVEHPSYKEGMRKYVTHLMVERNASVVRKLKSTQDWLCDICDSEFYDRYGVRYIEAHHKKPIATYANAHRVDMSEFALLCPNCHRAVHMYMRSYGMKYSEIKRKLSHS